MTTSAWLRYLAAGIHGIFHLEHPAGATVEAASLIPPAWFTHVAPGKAATLYQVDASTRNATVPFPHELPVTPEQVASCRRPIALVIHGVFGTTMGTHFAPLKHWLTDPAGRYGLVLGYEYDSIQCGIATVAADLRVRLAALGLLAGQPRLDLYTHSMGGLVARWLLEHPPAPNAPGQDLVRASVRRVFLAGPPNRGSHMADLGERIIARLQRESHELSALDEAALPAELAHVGLPLVSWAARHVGRVLPSVGAATQGLADLEPGSAAIAALLRSAQRLSGHLPYYLIQGIYAPVPEHEPVALRLLRAAANDMVELPPTRSDLVVNIDSQSGYGPLLGVDPTLSRPDRLILPGTWHRDYWQKPETVAIIVEQLLQRLPE